MLFWLMLNDETIYDLKANFIDVNPFEYYMDPFALIPQFEMYRKPVNRHLGSNNRENDCLID